MEKPLYGNHSLRNLTLQKLILRMCTNHGISLREAPAQEKHGSNGLCPNSFSTPPTLKQTDALWELFSPKICQFFKTAVSTLEMDILTITMVKLCS